MRKKFDIKKIVSGVLTAASLSSASVGTQVSAASYLDSVQNDDWNVYFDDSGAKVKFGSESDAQEKINELASNVWSEGCKIAINATRVKQSDYVHNRVLANARAAFVGMLRSSCYGVKESGRFFKDYYVQLNESKIMGIRAAVAGIVTNYLKIDSYFTSNKSDLLGGNPITGSKFLKMLAESLENANYELQSLPSSSNYVLRNLLYAAIFGSSSNAGYLASLSNLPVKEIRGLNDAMNRLNDLKSEWADKLQALAPAETVESED